MTHYIALCLWVAYFGGFFTAAIFAGSRRTISEDDLRAMQQRWIRAGRLEERRARWKEKRG